jgi:hypothetical protein
MLTIYNVFKYFIILCLACWGQARTVLVMVEHYNFDLSSPFLVLNKALFAVVLLCRGILLLEE